MIFIGYDLLVLLSDFFAVSCQLLAISLINIRYLIMKYFWIKFYLITIYLLITKW